MKILNVEQIKNDIIIPRLKPEEQLIGFFQSQEKQSVLLVLLTGPLSVLGLKFYYVAVTDKGIHFHKLSMFGKVNAYSYFLWNEIESINLQKKLFSYILKLQLPNNRELKLSISSIKINNKKVPKLDETTKNFILSKMI